MTEKNFKNFFKNKKITVIGLGLLGGALGDIAFLAKHGAEITVTDLKSEKELRFSMQKLKKFSNIKYVLGRHELEDFKNRDMILQPGNVPADSPYLSEAKKNKIPIYVSESLFAEYAPPVTIVGVTGTRGKSMTTALIYEILKHNEKYIKYPSTSLRAKKPSVFLGGNVRNTSTLALLEKVKAGDVVVMELDSWALHGMGDIKRSPEIAVFTSFMPDHMNFYGSTSSPQVAMKKYFADKANIFKFQKKDDVLIIRPEMKKLIKKEDVKSRLVIVKSSDFQTENRECAIEVAKQFKIPDSKISKALKNFKGLEGRLQYLKTVRGVKIYNDNNATTPEATMAGIEALSISFPGDKKIILICGGADKKLPLDDFVKVLDKYCKAVIMIPGTGTDRLVSSGEVLVSSMQTKDLEGAMKNGMKLAKKGDFLLFSPAFASFGQFNNEYERNDLFMKIIKNLK